jgi:hypothetical protein
LLTVKSDCDPRKPYPNIVKTAKEKNTRPPTLYKYFPPVSYVEKVLSGESIMFSCPPVDFNDPFEFRPIVQYSDQAEAHANYRRLLMKEGMNSIEARLRADTIVERFGTDGLPFHEMASYTSVVSKWGALCLTSSPTSLLMWAHYARDHKGVCIGFRAEAPPFDHALRVRYRDEYPIMDFSVRDDRRHYANVENALLVKSKCWSYEKEWRILKTTWSPDPSNSTGEGNLFEERRRQSERGPGLYALDRNCIAEVIIGHRCSEAYAEQVIGWTVGIPELQIFKSTPADRRFRIDLLRL